MVNFESIAAIFSTLAALAVVLLGAWFLLKWVGRGMSGPVGTRHIKVLDRVPVAQDKCLLLVRVAEKTMLIGMSSGAVTKLCDLDDPNGALEIPETREGQNFSALFQSVLKKTRGREEGDSK